MCGELLFWLPLTEREIGSSPRVRGTPRRSSSSPRSQPVHPRVCGELPPAPFAPASATGSSPRVRGTRSRLIPFDPGHRFIPACAGNSRALAVGGSVVTVHPRVCGELEALRIPPLARCRFIPACAGNSKVSRRSPARGPVHPRVCGELVSPATIRNDVDGSSPRVRGTRRAPRSPAALGRFIPACAGNSRATTRPAKRETVHPRVCGELESPILRPFSHTGSSRVCGELGAAPMIHQLNGGSSPRVRGTLNINHASPNAQSGSSPRVRGTHDEKSWWPRSVRFIPACAGNSRRSCWRRAAPAVHPRVCGELHGICVPSSISAGSSPRVRGTRGDSAGGARPPGGSSPRVRGTRAGGRHPDEGRRFIPACAGNSIRDLETKHAAPVHPRVCGELSKLAAQSVRSDGSSPRVRGTRLPAWAAGVLTRFIPACAGNSTAAPKRSRRRPVHPRVCGELAGLGAFFRLREGSSPRVRGTRPRAGPRDAARRFIPACAGNSPRRPNISRAAIGSSPRVRGTRAARRTRTAESTVHPRVCGELPRFLSARGGHYGSSPRVRGTRRLSVCRGATGAVHPRVCGELSKSASAAIRLTGSSPRVRGTR